MMKTKLRLLLYVTFLLVLSSCTKEKEEENTGNNGLIGKWKLIEKFDGYVGGGGFTWQPVAAANSHTLEFTATGQYIKKDAGGSNPPCSGTYQRISPDVVEINSNCQTVVERTKISELTNRNLILDYQGREGVIRYKYAAE